MSIDDVIKNLNQTIVGKMVLMDEFEPDHIMREILVINIGELERIRNDLEKVKENTQKA